jgi:hypothetical protein
MAAQKISISRLGSFSVLGFLAYTVYFGVSISKSLRVLSQEIGVDTLPFPYVLSTLPEKNIENISRVIAVTSWSTIILKVIPFLQKQSVDRK